jgi:hypothetical protein
MSDEELRRIAEALERIEGHLASLRHDLAPLAPLISKLVGDSSSASSSIIKAAILRKATR